MKNKGSFQKGHAGYWKGKQNFKKRTGEYRNCLYCEKEFYAERNQIVKGWGKFCSGVCRDKMPKSEETRLKMSAWQKGEKNKNWRGGKKAVYRERFDYKWNKLKREIYLRDNRTCQKCMKKCDYRDIQCHHIIPYRRVGGDINKIMFWDVTINSPGNLITLCASCHLKEDRKIRKAEERGDYGIQAVYHILA